MKTLKENTITPKGICFGGCLNIFTISEESDRNKPNYVSLSRMKNRKIFVDYKFDEDGTEKDGKIKIVIPEGDDDAIKAFVISEINNELSK